jgi:hypothetical protein
MRAAALRRRPAAPRPVRRPVPGGARTPFEDPRGPGAHSTLPYREATELLRCIQIMGPQSDAFCRHEVLGEPLPPTPEFQAVAGISSPVPFRATVNPDGSASTRIGRVDVRIEPDQTSADPAMQNRAETTFTPSITTPSATTLNGRIQTITLGTPEASIAIRTVYGPGTSPGIASGYGRGTTAADVAAGETTLGFHEGRHGVDFLRYMAAVPQPIFAGARGQTVAQFNTARTAYTTAWNAYFSEMEHRSVHHTDCVGSTAAASPKVQAVCTHTHPPVPNP